MSGANGSRNSQKKAEKGIISVSIPKDLVKRMDEQCGNRKRSDWLRTLIKANLRSSENANRSIIDMKAHELNQGLEEGFDALKEELTSLIANKLDDYRRKWSVQWRCNECGAITPGFSGSCPTYNGCSEMQVPVVQGPLSPALFLRSGDYRRESV